MATIVKIQNRILLVPLLIFLGLHRRSDRINLVPGGRKGIKKSLVWSIGVSMFLPRRMDLKTNGRFGV